MPKHRHSSATARPAQKTPTLAATVAAEERARTAAAPPCAAASVPAAPNYRPEDVAFRARDIPSPNPPHSQRLQIVRAQGGYIMFAADDDFDQADADPADAVAVASTPQELLRRVDAWAQADAPNSYPA
jgi:hypothetical protein